MTTLPEKELLRPDEVAEYFSVSRRTVYNWIDSGKVEAVKITDTTIRIVRKSLEHIQKSPHE